MARKQGKLFDVSAVDVKLAEEQIRSLQRTVDFDMRDFPIEYLVKKFNDDDFYVPPYQREYIWDDSRRCHFIESVILGLPIPMMFFADMEDGRLEIVDGAQRMNTLESFLNNDLELKKLDKLNALNGFTFSDLPDPQKRKFEARTLRTVVLEDSTAVELRHEIFRRINTKAMRARASEIRKGAFAGPFMDFVARLAKSKLFNQLCPMSETYRKRKEPEELVIRFFAYSDRYAKFRHDVETFLDKFVKDHRERFDEDRMHDEFNRMLAFVDRYFPYGFAKTANGKQTPRVRFEAIAVGTNLALRQNSSLVPPDPRRWLKSDEFSIRTTTHASNSLPRLRARIEYVRDQLLEECE